MMTQTREGESQLQSHAACDRDGSLTRCQVLSGCRGPQWGTEVPLNGEKKVPAYRWALAASSLSPTARPKWEGTAHRPSTFVPKDSSVTQGEIYRGPCQPSLTDHTRGARITHPKRKRCHFCRCWSQSSLPHSVMGTGVPARRILTRQMLRPLGGGQRCKPGKHRWGAGVRLRPRRPLRRRVPGRPAPQRTYRHEPPRGCLTLQGGWQGWAWFAWGHPISERVKGREWTWGLQGSLSHCLPTVPALWPLAGLGHSPLPTPPSQKPSTQADSTRNGLLNRPRTFHISLIMPFPSMQLPFLSGGARVLAALPGSEQIPLPTKCPASPQHREPLRSRTLTILLHPPVGH